MPPNAPSRLPGFHRLRAAERAKQVAAFARLTTAETALLHAATATGGPHPADRFDRMVENCVGSIGLPLGIATNFVIDGVDRLIPMATEEPSVVAAASHAARMARPHGGFTTSMQDDLMIGQVHLLGLADPAKARAAIVAATPALLESAEPEASSLQHLGGGCKGLELRLLDTRAGPAIVVHLLVDTRDAMGANAVNTRVEALADALVALVGGQARLRILSNLADRRTVTARATFASQELGGADAVSRILDAQWLAEADPYRAATHNKGVMNGVDALVAATGNDWRAVEAGAHAFAARGGTYQPLTTYTADNTGNLVGTLTLPVAVGIVGGATVANPMAALCLKILGASSAQELARACAAVGLAQNLAALRALTSEGIQAGHMRLHARVKDRT